MVIYIILGVVILLAFGVVGFLFFILNKEAVDGKVQPVPITNLNELRTSSEPLKVPVGGNFDIIKEQEKIKERFQQEYEAKEASYQRRVDELEGELHAISQKAQEQSKEALLTAEKLSQENEQLKLERNNEIIAAEANLIRAQERVTSLQDEQAILQGRLTESHGRVEKLQEEAIFFKQQMTQEIQEVKTQTEQLSIENQALKISMDNTRADVAKEFQTQIDALNQENQKLKESQQELMLENQRLKDSIEELNKNSETLQWELTKSRAQMTSFERACENYQLQLKEALERIGTSDDGQGKLSDMNKHLQSTVEEAQKQNEEFLKREKLFESELEKNRIQIAALERDCEHLKADVNKGQ